MHLNFVTIVDVKYLPRALALLQSIERHCPQFHCWIVALDDQAATLLRALNLPQTTVVCISDLNDPELASVRAGRTIAEFSWTAKPSILQYIMRRIQPDEGVTYLDADLFLCSDPIPLYTSLQDVSIAITPHRFSPPDPEKERLVGKYNAGWIYMKNDATAEACLNRWHGQCIAWCYYRYEDGKLGDQMYLDEWVGRYPNVRDIADIGVNAGPWNMRGKAVLRHNRLTLDDQPLVWYHFHAIKMYLDRRGKLRPYPVSIVDPYLYALYFEDLNEATRRLRRVDPSYTVVADPHPGFARILKQHLFRLFHV